MPNGLLFVGLGNVHALSEVDAVVVAELVAVNASVVMGANRSAITAKIVKEEPRKEEFVMLDVLCDSVIGICERKKYADRAI